MIDTSTERRAPAWVAAALLGSWLLASPSAAVVIWMPWLQVETAEEQEPEPSQPEGARQEEEGAAEPDGEEDGKEGEEEARRETKSGYTHRGASNRTGVRADLFADDLLKRPVVHLLSGASRPLYKIKERFDGRFGLAFGVDYNFLNQYASFSFTEDHASSGSLRFFGTWDPFHTKEKLNGDFVFRVENRHRLGAITPRDMGFDTGSALSTASFKDFDWGVTSLYWDQAFFESQLALVFGQMDPGDFMDAFPLLSAWTSFMNDAFFNNPSEALPQQGVGLVMRYYFGNHIYLSAGVHDALADADGLNVSELFDAKDLFSWYEIGWSPSKRAIPGDSIHVTVWTQDSLDELGTSYSKGVALSVAPSLFGRYKPFLRAGFSNGDAPLMRRIVALGLGVDMREGNDLVGFATSWGAPADRSAGEQWSTEIFYRLQLTEHIQVTPDLQFTYKPAFNDQRDSLYVGSVVRLRLAI